MLGSNSIENKEVLIQGSLKCNAPAFCARPTWYVSGCEKKVKIGSRSFNYIDYLEAWCNHDCGTHRSRDALWTIEKQIAACFKEIEEKTNYIRK